MRYTLNLINNHRLDIEKLIEDNFKGSLTKELIKQVIFEMYEEIFYENKSLSNSELQAETDSYISQNNNLIWKEEVYKYLAEAEIDDLDFINEYFPTTNGLSLTKIAEIHLWIRLNEINGLIFNLLNPKETLEW
ncbi:hypothetical protein [[Mycoplasma] anseris]|uniref:Uncharacterized protein n=1 Tax=[Mycoplasma] anseris TaxID=92400 RepID=A0A2Z4ND91_9BACT|nr:hypothetical protein [[Mycoplasma] anseris]AWX69554.1 hypothetical protein DP065_02200 [[Mycoplasma] anseris]